VLDFKYIKLYNIYIYIYKLYIRIHITHITHINHLLLKLIIPEVVLHGDQQVKRISPVWKPNANESTATWNTNYVMTTTADLNIVSFALYSE